LLISELLQSSQLEITFEIYYLIIQTKLIDYWWDHFRSSRNPRSEVPWPKDVLWKSL